MFQHVILPRRDLSGIERERPTTSDFSQSLEMAFDIRNGNVGSLDMCLYSQTSLEGSLIAFIIYNPFVKILLTWAC